MEFSGITHEFVVGLLHPNGVHKSSSGKNGEPPSIFTNVFIVILEGFSAKAVLPIQTMGSPGQIRGSPVFPVGDFGLQWGVKGPSNHRHKKKLEHF